MNSELQDSLSDFLRTLDEVDILLSSAEECIHEETKYAAYNKSALLLLSGKFENFVETITEQYVFLVNKLNLRSSLLPEEMRLHHTYAIIDKLSKKSKNSSQSDEVKRMLSEIGSIWVSDTNFNQLNIDCKFAYGKHGESELVKLFKPIGIKDVFLEVEVFIPDSNSDDFSAEKRKVDFKGIFNSVMNMRNNILHQDASPSLTDKSIREYKLSFQSFAEAVTNKLDNNLNKLIEVAS